MDWFSQERFGMFIHWGIYSHACGCWKGMETPWVSEWMMHKFRIPRQEYREMAKEFNPVAFDADEWVKSALDAGMKYMVVTAKHHDGFAMFDSSYDDFNICKLTPFKRDAIGELADAAHRHGLRFGVYYSHEQDWNEAGAVGNTWDFSPEEKTPEAFEAYLHGKVYHQVRELLTNYGKIDIIWFDTPVRITEKQSLELGEFVKSIAPDCLVNSRIGGGREWDFETLPDNQLPAVPCTRRTEAISTMNESWGYKPIDLNYHSSSELLERIASAVSHNANFLLNVGPDGKGAFPPEAVSRLQEIGSFIKVRGEALYGAKDPGVIYSRNNWGKVSRNGDSLYFWLFRNPGEVRFYGIRSAVKSAGVLVTGEKVVIDEYHNKDCDYHRIIMTLPENLQLPAVIKVTYDSAELDCFKEAYSCGSC